jgi:hypothetical protein
VHSAARFCLWEIIGIEVTSVRSPPHHHSEIPQPILLAEVIVVIVVIVVSHPDFPEQMPRRMVGRLVLESMMLAGMVVADLEG